MEKMNYEELKLVAGGRLSDEMMGRIHIACCKAAFEGITGEEFMDKVLPSMFPGGDIPEDAWNYAGCHWWF